MHQPHEGAQTEGSFPTESPAQEEGLLETAVSVVTEPVRTLRQVTHQRPIRWALTVTLVLSLASALVLGATVSPSDFSLDPSPDLEEVSAAFRIAAIVAAAILFPIFAVVFLATVAGVYKGMSLMLGGKGPYSGLFAGFGIASVPSAIGIPISLLTALGGVGSVLSGLAQFGLAIWVIVLYGVAIRENNGFTTARAAVALLIPIAVFAALAMVLIFSIIALLIVSTTL